MPDIQTPTRILILDDDEIMRQVLQELLSIEGFEATLASSAPEAIALLQAGLAVDLVLTDLQMPGVSGTALAATLREVLPPKIPLLAMSGSEPQPDVRAAFDGFLLKPFDGGAVRIAAQAARGTARAPQAVPPQPQTFPEQPQASPEQPQTFSEHSGKAQAPILDEAIFSSLRNLIPADKLAELYELTVADILKRYERMREAAARRDLVTVKQEAHATKGSCGMVGAQQLQQIAATIEEGTSINTGKIGEIPEACAQLRSMLTGKLK